MEEKFLESENYYNILGENRFATKHIPVNDSLAMKKLEPRHNLSSIKSCSLLSEPS